MLPPQGTRDRSASTERDDNENAIRDRSGSGNRHSNESKSPNQERTRSEIANKPTSQSHSTKSPGSISRDQQIHSASTGALRTHMIHGSYQPETLESASMSYLNKPVIKQRMESGASSMFPPPMPRERPEISSASMLHQNTARDIHYKHKSETGSSTNVLHTQMASHVTINTGSTPFIVKRQMENPSSCDSNASECSTYSSSRETGMEYMPTLGEVGIVDLRDSTSPVSGGTFIYA